MTKVFPPEWLECWKKRYATRPAFERPALYGIAFDIEYTSIRAEIEQLIEIVDSAHQPEVIGRLRDARLHRHSYHELVIGGFLKSQGYKVEYEKRFSNDLTPDWYAFDKKGIPEFLVEVFTYDLSEEVVKIKRQVRDLCGKITSYSRPGNSQVEVNIGRAKGKLNSQANKRIAKHIADWLSNQDRALGEKTCVDGVTARIVLVDGTPVRAIVKSCVLRNSI